MSILNRKVFRELARMRGQVIAITLVMACGIMLYVSSRHTLYLPAAVPGILLRSLPVRRCICRR